MAELSLVLHKKQLEVFRDPAQLIFILAGRGWGKSMLMLFVAIVFCLTYSEPINPASPQVALIVMPTFKQAKSIFWLPLLNLLELLPIVENVNKSDYRITFSGQRPDLLLRGADLQGTRLRGLNLAFVGCDEAQDLDPNVWSTVLQPALSRNKNWRALIIGTPKGKVTTISLQATTHSSAEKNSAGLKSSFHLKYFGKSTKPHGKTSTVNYFQT
jgi:hypothetical protein